MPEIAPWMQRCEARLSFQLAETAHSSTERQDSSLMVQMDTTHASLDFKGFYNTIVLFYTQNGCL